MGGIRYTEEFKVEAVKQVTERGYGVVEVSKRLGISDKSLYLFVFFASFPLAVKCLLESFRAFAS